MSEIKHTYGDVEISYEERSNLWKFELRGRERSAESLAKAKEIIDKPVKDKNEFKRFKAYKVRYSGDPQIVEVTSIAEGSSWDARQYFWIVAEGQRSKCSASDLFLINPENDVKIAEMNRLAKESEALDTARANIENTLQGIKSYKEEFV